MKIDIPKITKEQLKNATDKELQEYQMIFSNMRMKVYNERNMRESLSKHKENAMLAKMILEGNV